MTYELIIYLQMFNSLKSLEKGGNLTLETVV